MAITLNLFRNGASLLANGADGINDIEGKAATEEASECGQRASFNAFGVGFIDWLDAFIRHSSIE